jgi:hypothetical protein
MGLKFERNALAAQNQALFTIPFFAMDEQKIPLFFGGRGNLSVLANRKVPATNPPLEIDTTLRGP